MFEDILKLIRAHDRIVLHRHQNPDGDALGAQLGLYYILKENFPEKEILAVGDMNRRYAFMLEGREMDTVADAAYNGALAIVLDTSAKALISDERYATAKATARIDHHIFCEKICDTEVTDTSFESCAGMIAALAMEAELHLTPAAAKALYTGMVTDSGRFRYDSTTAKTFALASFLMQTPFKTQDIYRNLYSDELASVKLRAHFVSKIQLTEAGVAYIYTTKEEAAATGADTFTISRGMVNTMSDIRGIDTWVNFTETEGGVLCEIRSSVHNINKVAVKWGGGGHKRASGATLKSREDAMALLKDLDEVNSEACDE
ncbi:MAG: bifunctional oligoribonuclease/PAP phosphatase NrnA [Clostridia bacterium]|nr:bifunctional oligoribonuclease/PAP phosphatase NrnA [Clostridia bacterium]